MCVRAVLSLIVLAASLIANKPAQAQSAAQSAAPAAVMNQPALIEVRLKAAEGRKPNRLKFALRTQGEGGGEKNGAGAADVPRETLKEIQKADDAYKALQILDDMGLKSAGISKSLRGGLHGALAAIEAAVRLNAFHARNEAFWRSFQGKLDAIRAAHAEHCGCSGRHTAEETTATDVGSQTSNQ